MEKVLRSVIDVNGSIDEEDLQRNLFYLHDSNLNFLQEEDQQVWEFVRDFATANAAAPSINSVRDYFEKERKIEVLDRIEEIEAVNRLYDKSDFESLIRDKVEEQNIRETSYLLKDASHILTNSLEEGGKKYKGYRDALRYIAQRSDDLLRSEGGHLVRSDITEDAKEVKKEFDNTLSNRQNAWGRGTGLDPIDTCCRGVKPGELWVHAGFTGELKCLSGSSKVYNHKSKKLEEIKNLHEKNVLPEVTALYREGEEPSLVESSTSHLVENGVRPVYTVKLKSGRELEITDNHPLWTSKEGGSWRDLRDIEAGDHVGVPSVMRVSNPRDDFTDAEVKSIGYLLGDGTVSDYIRLTSTNPAIIEDFSESLRKLGYHKGEADYATPSFCVEYPENRAPYIRVSHSAGNGNSTMTSPLRLRFEELGLWQTDSSTKHIPGEMVGLPDRQVALLLGALWSTDGSCHTGDHERPDRDSLSKRNDITYGTKSKELATGIQTLLTRLGIQSTVRPVNTTYEDKPYLFYTVRIVNTPSKKRFCNLITVVGKEDRFNALRDRLSDVDDRVFPTDLISHMDRMDRAKSPTGSWRYAGQAQDRSTITADGLRIFSQFDPDLEKHLDGDVVWDKIESIELKGEEMTYDLSVPEHHSFVVNDVITHNTTFALNWAYKTAFIFKYNVYYYSLEMPVEQVRRIIYVMHSNHPKWKRMGYEPLTYRMIRDGVDTNNNKITQEQIDFFNMIVEDVENGQGKEYGRFFVECPDRGATIPHIKNRVEMVHQNTPIHLMFIDHFGLVQGHRNLNDYYQELNSIVREAKATALNFNRGEKIPIVALHQINREGKKEARKNDGKYNLQALADANEVERSADVITYTYLNENYRARNETLIGCLKNRDNPHFDPFVAKVDLSNRFIKNLISPTNGSATIGLNGNEDDFDLGN